ncbi:MAG: hypothetical protein H6832_07675 [Planctomycetes bacterium]|nr:hypothetical protein [Planctomycetota bacterium]MCB9918268.1 hypothetical protein [Planctomycetota bacterium]
MRAFILLGAVLAPAALLGAQTTLAARLTTLTDYGNFAREGTALAYQSIAANKDIPSTGTSVSANLSNTSAATLISHFVRGDVVTVDVSEQGTATASSTTAIAGTTASPSNTAVVQGPHELLFEIKGRAGTRGLLEMWASGIAQAGSGVKLGVDIDNDQTIDFASVPSTTGSFDRAERSITIPASGLLQFRIVTSASITLRSGYTVYKTGLSIRFTPGVACDIEAYGQSCGPRLGGMSTTTGTQRSLTLALASSNPTTPTVLIIGNQRLALQLPGTNCYLHSNYIASLGFVTDASGNAVQKFDFPANAMFSLTLQDAMFPGLTSIETTNGLSVVCK